MRGVSGFLAELGFCWFGGSAVLATRRSGGLGADEVEGAALVGGGFGEHGDVGVGVVVADLVAGQGWPGDRAGRGGCAVGCRLGCLAYSGLRFSRPLTRRAVNSCT